MGVGEALEGDIAPVAFLGCAHRYHTGQESDETPFARVNCAILTLCARTQVMLAEWCGCVAYQGPELLNVIQGRVNFMCFSVMTRGLAMRNSAGGVNA